MRGDASALTKLEGHVQVAKSGHVFVLKPIHLRKFKTYPTWKMPQAQCLGRAAKHMRVPNRPINSLHGNHLSWLSKLSKGLIIRNNPQAKASLTDA